MPRGIGRSGVLLVCLTLLQGVQSEDGYFWHITDHHYDTTYWTDQRSCNDEVPDPGIYGDYWCDSPWRLVNDSINAMAALKKDVDFILWTGDNVPHIKDEYTNETYVLDVLQSITDALKTSFPGVKVYATMGNHDWHPDGQFPDITHRLYNDTANLWKDWIVSPEQLQNFRRGAYYTLKGSHGLRILALNTNVYYTADKLTSDLEDPVGQFAWMEDVFKKARTDGEKVLVTAHIAPGILVPGEALWFQDRFHTRFMDIMRSNYDIIVGMFCGHDHMDIFRHLRNNGEGPGVPMYMAPSVTPWRFKIPNLTGDPHNPAVRLFKYDRGSNLPLEYHQYYLNLTEANRRNDSDWKLAYNTRDLYGMNDLSAASLSLVIKKMAEDTSTLNNYIRYINLLATGETTVRDCDEMCRAKYTCAFDKPTRTLFNECVTALVGAATGRYAPPVLIIITAIFAVIGMSY